MRTILLFVSALLAASPLALGSEKLRLHERRIPGSYIVVLKEGQANSRALIEQIVAQYQGWLKHHYKSVLKGFSVDIPETLARILSEDPRVAFVEEDAMMTVEQTGATWGLDRIDQQTLPLDSTYHSPGDGRGVNVYVIDTGIRPTHQEFQGRASAVFDVVDDGRAGEDCHGHGTHVAGTIGGVTYGVAKQANLRAVRVMDCVGSGPTSNVIAGVDWVTQNRRLPAVANMSLGGPGSLALDQAVRRSIASGVTYVAAAGNEAVDACLGSPARVPAAITVGATTNLDAVAPFSNFGSCVDLFAPGANVTSAWTGGDGALKTISGTSMAAPHVAGVAALYLQANPGALPAAVSSAILNSAVAGAISRLDPNSPNRLLSVIH